MGIYSEEAKALLEATNVDTEESIYKEMVEEATELLMEGIDSDIKFKFNKKLLEDPKKVKELCKVIEDDMTKPSLRNFLVNNFIRIVLESILWLPLFLLLPFYGCFHYLEMDYMNNRHEYFVNSIDKSIGKLKSDGSSESKKKIDSLNEAKKILNDAKAKYKTLEAEERKKTVGFVLKKKIHLY